MNKIIDFLLTFVAGGIGGGFIVYLTKSIWENYLALNRSIKVLQLTEFNKAAADFRAAFTEVLFYLRQNTENGIGKKELIFKIINTKDLICYERAVIVFEPFINDGDMNNFRTAWKNCKEYMQKTENEWADSKNPADTEWIRHLVVSTDKGLNLNQEYLKHIEDLLEYAKRK